MKVTSALLLCPVLLVSCGRSRDGHPSRIGSVADTVITAAVSEPLEFEVVPSLPETLAVTWTEPSHAVLNRSVDVEGPGIQTGDTLFWRTDDLEQIEMERLGMELAFLDAALSTGDSTVLGARDSVFRLLDGLDGMVPWTCPCSGSLLYVADSGSVAYGDTLAVIGIPPDSIFTLVAPRETVVHFWPETSGDSRLIESAGERAVYSGVAGGYRFSFPHSWTVPRQAIYERGLDHYVIGAGGDTVDVMRLATSPTGVAVMTSGRDISGLELVLWAAPGN